MNIRELSIALKEAKVKPSWYSLDGKLIPDRMIIRKRKYNWEVFYFGDRGGVMEKKTFDSETDACEYFYAHFMKQRVSKDIDQYFPNR
jgi:hypothetical protein